MLKLDKNNYDNTFLFLSIIWCSICEKSKTISFGPCNIMIAQQHINVISSQLIVVTLLHTQFIIATLINFITRVLLFETLMIRNFIGGKRTTFDLLWKILSNLMNSGFYKDARINEIFEPILFILGCRRVTFLPTNYANLTFC